MRKRWILIGLAVGLLTVAVTGGVALAHGGGPGNGWGWGRGDQDSRLSDLAGKVAGILETDEDETLDAINQARQELRDEAYEADLDDLAERVAETLETDAEETADAMAKVSEEMYDEALETKLQDAIDDERITEEQAQEYRDNADSYGAWYGYGYGNSRGRGFKSGSSGDFASRLADELELEADDVEDAIDQAFADIRTEDLESKLEDAVDNGRLTQEEADAILVLQKADSGIWSNFDRRSRFGNHGDKGLGSRGGRGHRGNRH